MKTCRSSSDSARMISQAASPHSSLIIPRPFPYVQEQHMLHETWPSQACKSQPSCQSDRLAHRSTDRETISHLVSIHSETTRPLLQVLHAPQYASPTTESMSVRTNQQPPQHSFRKPPKLSTAAQRSPGVLHLIPR